MRKPTIYEALTAKLGRPPTHAECCADAGILTESLVEQATKGRPAHQRKRR